MIEKKYMEKALLLAEKAAQQGEVPVGAVIVRDGEIIGEGYNKRETGKTATGHAEIQAIEQACRRLSSWRLSGCEMYVTLEPCPMCAGAIINSRLDRVVFACYDDKAGCFGTKADFNEIAFNHAPSVVGGYMAEESGKILKSFFLKRR